MVTISEDTTEFYIKAHEHHWRCRADNGEIIGASSKGFSSKDVARKNAGMLGLALTMEAREKLVALCKMLENSGFKLTWYDAEAATDEHGAVKAHWYVQFPDSLK